MLFSAVYIEEEIAHHPFVQGILQQYPDLPRIPCSRYTEVFNRKSQNFRLQKKRPALILAKKFKNFVLMTPEGYTIGGKYNYYFSHMMNCIYDCRYCFLQGMYRSANYVVFVNQEDFLNEIQDTLDVHPDEKVHFFSGYDCDSLALENVTGFLENTLPFFASHPQAVLEIRTKSNHTQFLLRRDPLPNCVVAYTLTPREIGKRLEHKTPPLKQRIKALKALQERGWPIGLRFDPLILCENYEQVYKAFFNEVFSELNEVHSVTLGSFRVPKPLFKNMERIYPDEPLFIENLTENRGMVSYPQENLNALEGFCKEILNDYIPKEKLF